MKKKILTFMLLLVIAGVVMIAGHEIGRHMHKAEQNTETTEASVDYSLYYTYEDVEKVVSYLADTKAESEALSRLIDPLKKSEVIDVAFVKSVAQTIQVKASIYEETLNGKKDSDYVTKAEFEDFYERIVASATVKGLLRKDVLVLAISEEDKTSFFDGQDTYNAEFEIDESYEGNVLDVYMKNGKIFKINRLGDTQITLQNVWVESVTDGKCTFLYGNLEKTYPARTEEGIPDGAVTVATSLDADRQTEAGYLYLALGGRQIAGEDIHNGGFARAVGPQQTVDLAVRHRKREILHGRAAAVGLAQVRNFDHSKLSFYFRSCFAESGMESVPSGLELL